MFKMSTASLHTSWQTTTPLTNRCCDDCVIQVGLGQLNTQSLLQPSKQEKYLITHLHVWSIAMEHAKNYEIRCKIIWNIRTKRVAPFSEQCNLQFLSPKVLQGSVATCVNYGMIFIDFFTANLLQSMMVKELWKSVRISQSYRQKWSDIFFRTRCIYQLTVRIHIQFVHFVVYLVYRVVQTLSKC